MPLSTKPFLAFALILTLVAGGPAVAEDGPQLVTLALIDTPWAMRLDVTGFHVQVDGVKPDGRFQRTKRSAFSGCMPTPLRNRPHHSECCPGRKNY